MSNTQQAPRTADPSTGDWSQLWPSAAPAAAFTADLVFVATDGGHRWPLVGAFLVLAVVTAGCSLGVRPWTVAFVALLGWLFAILLGLGILLSTVAGLILPGCLT